MRRLIMFVYAGFLLGSVTLCAAQSMTLGEMYPEYILLTQQFALVEDGIAWTGPSTSIAQRRIVDDFWRFVTDIGPYSFYFTTAHFSVQGLPDAQGLHLRRIGAIDRTIVCASDKPLARSARELLDALGCRFVDLETWHTYPGAHLCGAPKEAHR